MAAAPEGLPIAIEPLTDPHLDIDTGQLVGGPQVMFRVMALDGLETTVVAYTTDIPAFGNTWGQPFLFGPGTIHVAHTLEERIPKRQLIDAVEIYQRMVQNLWKRE